VFASNPSWIAPLLPQVTDLWSPDLSAFGNSIHLYYTASAFNSGQSCIGHATTPSLDHAFQDSGKPILCAGTGSTPDTFDAVDPSVVLDDLGNPWLVFGSWKDGIHILALDQAGDRLNDQMTRLAARPASANALQAAFIYRGPEYFYLFVSFDSNPSHTLHVGRSKQVTGPYVDRAGTDMLQGGGTILLQSNDIYKGPGSNSVFNDNGCALNAYHAYDGNGDSMLRIAPLVFDKDQWPVTGGP
jgi:arabinan endo-1,5-alpha-L-arabinosidase